jgi:hypothetical protein
MWRREWADADGGECLAFHRPADENLNRMAAAPDTAAENAERIGSSYR